MSRRTLFSRIGIRTWIALGLLVVVLLTCSNLERLDDAADTGQTNPAGAGVRVIRVVDGDTIVVDLNGALETVRYVGIDTPERGQPGYRAATEANRAFVHEQRVFLQRDVSDRDNFGRLLRFVVLGDGTLVNAAMLAQGWAMPVEYRPDTTRAEEFRRLAVQAAHQRQGFWSGESPYDGAIGLALVTQVATLRSGPGTAYDAISDLPVDTPVTVYQRSTNSRWVQVRPPDRRGGWLSVNAIQLNVPVSSLPTTEVAPPPQATPQSARCPQGCEVQPDPTCVVKGNVGVGGERIFHLPGGASYNVVVIRPEEGDRWFCTVVEAERNGFRAALR